MIRPAFVLILAAASLFAQKAPPAAEQHKIQVLIVTGREDHDWRGITPLMRRYLEAAGIFETRIAEEFRDASSESFGDYDVIVLANSDKAPTDRWNPRTQKALLDFVQAGKGLVVYHHSATAFKDWPDYARLCGGNYYGKAQHADLHDFTVDFVDRKHPITKGLPKGFLQPHDELYANLVMQPEGTYHVLASAWDDHELYHGKSKIPLVGPGANEPLMWTVDAGKGRVFATMIGHSVEAVQSAGFRATFTRGVEWAATGKVTQPPPTDIVDPNE